MTNRETIKFRVWDTKQKCYLRYYDVNVWHESPLLNDIFENERMVFQQYTGLKDKNGVEIYEGDIIKLGAYYYEIVWEDYSWACDDHGSTHQSINTQGMNRYMTDGCEVIGNIFETPELLEK